jgi:hypothetical protein
MIVVDDYDDYGVTNEGGKKEVFSCLEERRADELGITNIDCNVFFFLVYLFVSFTHFFFFFL